MFAALYKRLRRTCCLRSYPLSSRCHCDTFAFAVTYYLLFRPDSSSFCRRRPSLCSHISFDVLRYPTLSPISRPHMPVSYCHSQFSHTSLYSHSCVRAIHPSFLPKSELLDCSPFSFPSSLSLLLSLCLVLNMGSISMVRLTAVYKYFTSRPRSHPTSIVLLLKSFSFSMHQILFFCVGEVQISCSSCSIGYIASQYLGCFAIMNRCSVDEGK